MARPLMKDDDGLTNEYGTKWNFYSLLYYRSPDYIDFVVIAYWLLINAVELWIMGDKASTLSVNNNTNAIRMPKSLFTTLEIVAADNRLSITFVLMITLINCREGPVQNTNTCYCQRWYSANWNVRKPMTWLLRVTARLCWSIIRYEVCWSFHCLLDI